MSAEPSSRGLVSIVFPAYNEADNLRRFEREVVPVFRSLGRPFEIVIVDDGSNDGTADVAAGLGPETRVIRHPRNKGIGAALRTGSAAARGELIVWLDADLTFAPQLVARLLERFDAGDVDVVSGSPYLAEYEKSIPRYRVIISRLARFVYAMALGRPLTAINPILRLYRRSDLLALDVRANGFEVFAETLFAFVRLDKRIVEVPAPLTQRISGHSKLNYRKEIARHLPLVGRILAWRVRNLFRR